MIKQNNFLPTLPVSSLRRLHPAPKPATDSLTLRCVLAARPGRDPPDPFALIGLALNHPIALPVLPRATPRGGVNPNTRLQMLPLYCYSVSYQEWLVWFTGVLAEQLELLPELKGPFAGQGGVRELAD